MPVIIDYTNYKGERTRRNITPKNIVYKSTEQHPMTQWILVAYDHDKQAFRDFAMSSIHSWEQL